MRSCGTRAFTTLGRLPFRQYQSPIMTHTPSLPPRSASSTTELSSFVTLLQTAVAHASASAGLRAKMVAASATPSEMEGPTVADEVHIPEIPERGPITKAYRSDNPEVPAWIPIVISRSVRYAISPPLSTT